MGNPAYARSYDRALELPFELVFELEVTEISCGELLHDRT